MKLHDIFIYLLDLPHSIHGFSRHNVDGSYTVILNARDSYTMQEWTKRHELKHIENEDHDGVVSVDMLEQERCG